MSPTSYQAAPPRGRDHNVVALPVKRFAAARAPPRRRRPGEAVSAVPSPPVPRAPAPPPPPPSPPAPPPPPVSDQKARAPPQARALSCWGDRPGAAGGANRRFREADDARDP